MERLQDELEEAKCKVRRLDGCIEQLEVKSDSLLDSAEKLKGRAMHNMLIEANALRQKRKGMQGELKKAKEEVKTVEEKLKDSESEGI